jgi:uncharacterized protein
MIHRSIFPQVVNALWWDKTIIVYWPRQVGKTTLVQNISSISECPVVYIDAEDLSIRDSMSKQDVAFFTRYFGKNKQIVIIDEAQKIPNIGANIKLIHDHLPRIQLIATGSSSFDIAQRIQEPMTGRVIEFHLYPLSLWEIIADHGEKAIAHQREAILLYGLYPDVWGRSDADAKSMLYLLCDQYVHKDLLAIDGIKKSEIIVSLLQLLAWQIGSEVSYHELATKLGISIPTVQKYITILEKAFIIKRLWWFSRNLRKEITKSQKIYFRDIGIRNALIQQFMPLSQRGDVWALRENVAIIELIKWHMYSNTHAQHYFRRTYDQQEIDYLAVSDTWKIDAYECKWSTRTKHIAVPTGFSTAYPEAEYRVVTPDTIGEMVA